MINGEDIRSIDQIEKHADWAEQIKQKYGEINALNAEEILRAEVGLVFSKVLEHAGVYKRTEQGKAAFMKFIEYVNSK